MKQLLEAAPGKPLESGDVRAALAGARALVENGSLAGATQALLEPLRATLAAGAALVALRADRGGGLEPIAAEPAILAPELFERTLAALRRREAHATQAAAFVDVDPAGEPAYQAPGAARHRLKHVLVAPVLLAGESAGFVAVSDKPDGFSPRDAAVAEVFAELVAVALVRSRTLRESELLFEEVQESRSRSRTLARRLVEAQEGERLKISRELHDEAGQSLASLRFGLRLLEREIGEGRDVAGQVAELMVRVDSVIDGLHRLAVDLRPASLDHIGLDAALRQFSRSTATRFGLAVRFKARGFGNERLPAKVETALYRIVQEAVTNVVRHARATRVDVLAEHRGDRVMVMVEDDGVGFDPEASLRGEHLGLMGLRERAEELGGTCQVESSAGSGSTVVVEVPSADPHPDR